VKGVCAVVGGQFGSEGKGAVVAHIAHQYNHHVRVGAANAGHTLYVEAPEGAIADGHHAWEKHVMQQVPCAAYANPSAELYIGPGALISTDIFERELERLAEWRSERGMSVPKVWVDPRAHLITEEHIDREQDTDLAARIGSTSATASEGIGAAQAARVMREESCVTAEDFYSGLVGGWLQFVDVPARLDLPEVDDGGILLEGTQGASLSLTTGRHPYITSRNTTAAGLLADCGVAPVRLNRCVLVVRTFPIRVAGNSGPFWGDSVETSWEGIGVDPNTEKTTVTKKVRRVATFSFDQIKEAARLNGPSEIALMFCDYLSPRLKNCTDANELDSDADSRIFRLIDRIQEETECRVTMLGTGPHHIIDLP
jgi:adenylosuccinate synthase